MAGCLLRGRRRWSVTYTSPRGLRTCISEFFRIWNRRAFQGRKPYQFPGWMKNSPYYFPGRGANPRPPAHPDFIASKESHILLVRPWGGGTTHITSHNTSHPSINIRVLHYTNTITHVLHNNRSMCYIKSPRDLYYANINIHTYHDTRHSRLPLKFSEVLLSQFFNTSGTIVALSIHYICRTIDKVCEMWMILVSFIM